MHDRHDVFLRWPFLWVLAFCCVFVFPFTFNGGDLLLVLSLLTPLPYMIAIGALWLACWAMVAIRAGLRHRHWRRCLSAIVLPAFLVLVCLNPREALSLAEQIGDRVRLQFSKPGYFAKINSLSSQQGQRLAVFPWGGFAGLGERLIVYDESGEVLLDESQRSSAWKMRAAKTDLSCSFIASHMEGHFYKAHIAC